jgi:hypothetical protein
MKVSSYPQLTDRAGKLHNLFAGIMTTAAIIGLHSQGLAEALCSTKTGWAGVYKSRLSLISSEQTLTLVATPTSNRQLEANCLNGDYTSDDSLTRYFKERVPACPGSLETHHA